MNTPSRLTRLIHLCDLTAFDTGFTLARPEVNLIAQFDLSPNLNVDSSVSLSAPRESGERDLRRCHPQRQRLE
jgi:hypothetical protein